MFSYHPNKINLGDESKYAVGWRVIPSNQPHAIAEIGLKYAISPITWREGRRKRSEFKAANWVGLDIDDGKTSLEMALREFGALNHIIAASKSHQLQKGDRGPCDRFHLFFQLEYTIRDGDEYEFITRHFARKIGADMSATDAARKFNPHREVITTGMDDSFLAVCPPYMRADKTHERKDYGSTLPAWVTGALNGHFDHSHRNTTVFKVAVRLKQAHYSEIDAIETIMASQIPIGESARKEVTQAVRSAFKQ